MSETRSCVDMRESSLKAKWVVYLCCWKGKVMQSQ